MGILGDHPAELHELRDITGIEQVPSALDKATVPIWVWFAAGVAVLLLLFIVHQWRRRKDPRPSSKTPERWALDELDRLEQESSSMRPGETHFQLANLLREFVQRRFDIPAAQRTTHEFTQALATTKVSTERLKLVAAILERCDLSKFADVTYSPEECQASIRLVRQFIANGQCEMPLRPPR